MQIDEATEKFINAWGTLGTNWGINRTMAQIHALLLISPEPLCTEDIMEKLQISRGNANMNIRALIDWGIAFKSPKTGERKEYFEAEKDIWAVSVQVLRERRKRELEPMLKALAQLQEVEGNSEKVTEFKKVTSEIKDFAGKAEGLLDTIQKADQNWFFSSIIKLFK